MCVWVELVWQVTMIRGLSYEYEWRVHVIENLMMFRVYNQKIQDQRVNFKTSSQVYRNQKLQDHRQVDTIDVL